MSTEDHRTAGIAPPGRRGRRATGQLVVTKTKAGTRYAVRFRHDGRRFQRTLGYNSDGMTKQKALAEIERLMSRLFLGDWDPAQDGQEPERETPEEETFDEYVLGREDSKEPGWLEKRVASGGRDGDGLSESGEADLLQCVDHLRAWFGSLRLSEITTEEVENFVHAKKTSPRGGKGPRAEEPLSGTYVRKMVRVLSAVLRDAVRHDRIPRNPAEDVRVKAPRFKGTSLDRADAISALLAAAGEIDAARRDRRGHGRPLLATLLYAGLRIDEALSLRWRDVNLAAGYLRIGRAKTEAGIREVDLLPPLREEIAVLRALRFPEGAVADEGALVYGTRTGGKESPSNIRNRILRPATERANAVLAAEGKEPMPPLTPHSLRRTFASLLVATGADPLHVADQLGHTDPGLSLRVYAQTVKRKDGALEALRALVEGADLPGVPAEPETVKLTEESA